MQTEPKKYDIPSDILFEQVDLLDKERVPAVYLIENTSGQYYVGATSDLGHRISWHKAALAGNRHPNKKFQESYNKNSDFYFFAHRSSSEFTAFELERLFIQSRINDPCLLNLNGVQRTTPPSKEAREAVGRKSKAYFQNPEINNETGKTIGEERREAARQRMVERYNNDGYSKTVSIDMKERWANPSFRERNSAIRKEIANRPEMLELASERSKKNWADSNYRDKVVSAIKNRWDNPEFKDKMNTFFNSSENRERLSRLHKGKVISEETRRKMSEAHKQRNRQ